jgi:hypothetical protein
MIVAMETDDQGQERNKETKPSAPSGIMLHLFQF